MSSTQRSSSTCEPCGDRDGCLPARDTDWINARLKENWTWHLRARPDDRSGPDMRFELAGSRNAIEAACSEGDQPQGRGRSEQEAHADRLRSRPQGTNTPTQLDACPSLSVCRYSREQ